MKLKLFTAASLLALTMGVQAAEDSTIKVGASPQAGEVNIGGPARPANAPAQAEPTQGAAPAIPRIGGQQVEPGKPAQVFTTMEMAAQAGVNPMAAPASAPQAEPAPLVAPRIEITDETFLGRLAALPFLFKVGALLLVGVGVFALREWKRS